MKKDLFKTLSVEEMKDLLRELLAELYQLLEEEEQEKLFLELFRGEEGRVPSMVYY
ncbi:hypothetical protein [Thermosulfurimonas sp.]|uniref:hypothetical protein n=1 Tax=Thermosulfurimonas sp. TaxID=2080236 RepID=UPI0025CBA793|nr:hypothetical protein [Thermosulfurimonas sp.]